ncbi:MAG: tRNA uridine-5-carboxymethylaminomethyl(34) synthesis GTPase MnmE [Pseudomonadota bacterium]
MNAAYSGDTICAVASGMAPSAVAIIRVSGSATRVWLENHVRGQTVEPRQACLRKVHDLEGALIDNAMVLWMPAPRSYTGENVLEIHLHGGQGVIEHALEALTSFPAIRLAEPGEFTRRAFEHQKMDLTQAEGIADLIDAETRSQKSQALAQMEGSLSSLYSDWKDKLQHCLALLQASIDFPDESEAPEFVDEPVTEILAGLNAQFEKALEDGEIDQRIRDGFTVAILGEPNAGKSTLLNYLAKRDAAIVTEIPGTTRDVIEVRCKLGGHIIWFQDTAGIRESSDPIEQEGIRRSERSAETADLRLFLVPPDVTNPPLPHLRQSSDIVVRTKADIDRNLSLTDEIPAISAKTGLGCKELTDQISAEISSRVGNRTSPVLTRIRHRRAIEKALQNSENAKRGIRASIGSELVADNVLSASRALESLIGRIGVEDVLGDVFSTFCIGK